MDPVTILGIVGSVVSIADVVAKSIKKLSDLKSRFRNVPRVLPTLIGQLYIIKSALDRLSDWSDNVLIQNPRYQELALQINVALDSFGPLLLSLQQHLDEYDNSPAQNADLTTMSKISFLWNENEMAVFLDLIDRQVNALSLLLQAVQCQTWTQQRDIIAEEDSQTILRLARDCTSSITGLADDASVFSEDTTALSLVFDFDKIILGSRAYQAAQRSHLKHVVRSGRIATDAAGESNEEQSLETPTPMSYAVVVPPTNARTEASVSDDRMDRIGIALPMQHSADAHTEHLNRTATLHASSVRQRAEREAEIRVAKEAVERAMAGRAESNIKENNSTRSQRSLQRRLQNYLRQRSVKSSRQTESELQQKRNVEAARNKEKLLILGSSESGKTTLLKLMKLHLEGEYTSEERKSFSEIVWSNIVQSTRVVLEVMEPWEISLGEASMEQHVQTIFMQPPEVDGDHLPLTVAIAIKLLWRDGGFQETYNRRREYQLCDNAKDYAVDIDRISASDYLPSDRDVVQSRVKTTGIRVTTFVSDEVTFDVFDFGGMRSERKKWMHCFENASTIVFTVDAAAYNRLLFEDETVNRMREMESLWQSIVNSRWFVNTDFILVFTKTDLLEERFDDDPPEPYFPDFYSPNRGAEFVDDYRAYLEFRFLNLIEHNEKSTSQIRIAWTNLVDVENNFAGDTFKMARELRDARKLGTFSPFRLGKLSPMRLA